MTGLHVITRFGFDETKVEHLHGLQRVYFCAHPDDLQLYLKPISKEVLSIVNCGVWYDLQSEQLDRINLFIVPITTKLLTENSKADSDLEYAFKNHIPILPLMQESNLEGELYEKKFGKLQFLDKKKDDGTGISYNEKLQRYLNSVLVSDETADKVRAAFDAYIFLSYRKKDREYADKLMRLIHQNDFCRDIAIWYDENLIPGEAFDSAIESAMKKSKLFAMAVTPNLVNEENYVHSVEYPEAKKRGMKIIPAELVKTDNDELKKQYPDIPNCVNPNNPSELSDALMQQLKEIAVRENDSDPMHNFFIGLAYFNGIDVEIDVSKGMAIIESAANDGLIEAYERLVSIYRNGIRVKRDLFKGIDWQLKLLEHCDEMLSVSRNNLNYRNVINVSILLGDYFKELSLYDEAKDLYERALNNSVELMKLDVSGKELQYLCWNRLFLICEKTKDYANAKTYTELCLDYASSQDSKLDVAINYQNAGFFYYRIKEYEKAISNSNKAISIYQKLTDDEKTALNLALVYNNLYLIYVSVGNVEEAGKQIEKGLKIISDLNDEHKNKYINEYLLLSSNFAYYLYQIGRYNDAEESIKKAYKIFRTAFKKGKRVDLLMHGAEICNTYGQVLSAKKSFEAAENKFNDALIIYKDSPCPSAFVTECACIENCMGIILMHQKKNALALERFENALAIFEDDNDDRINEENKALYFYNISCCYYRLRNKKIAIEKAGVSIEYYKRVGKYNPNFAKNGILKATSIKAGAYFKSLHLIKGLKSIIDTAKYLA